MNEHSQTTKEAETGGVDGKSIAIIAYLTIIGLVVAFIMNNSKKEAFASYHIKQSLGLCILGFGLFILGMVPILGWIISFLGSVFLLVLWVVGLINAINFKEKPVPLVGKYFEDWFRNL